MSRTIYIKIICLLFFCYTLFVNFTGQILHSKTNAKPELIMEIPDHPDGNIWADSFKLKIKLKGISENNIIGYHLFIGENRNEYIKKEFGDKAKGRVIKVTTKK